MKHTFRLFALASSLMSTATLALACNGEPQAVDLDEDAIEDEASVETLEPISGEGPFGNPTVDGLVNCWERCAESCGERGRVCKSITFTDDFGCDFSCGKKLSGGGTGPIETQPIDP